MARNDRNGLMGYKTQRPPISREMREIIKGLDKLDIAMNDAIRKTEAYAKSIGREFVLEKAAGGR